MTRPSERTIVTVGCVLFVAYVVMAGFIEWPWLEALQQDDTFKVVTGLGLAVYLHQQWSMIGHRDVGRHRLGGALAPLVLYLHASHFGYGYLILLALIYLGSMGSGLLHGPVVGLRTKWMFTLWFVVHVATSVMLVLLGGYHVIIALAYE